MNHPTKIELATWVDATGADDEIEAHVRSCETCQREVNRLRAIASSLERVGERTPVSESFVSDLAARIDRAPTSRKPLGLIVAAVTLGLAVLIAPRFFETPREFTPRGSSAPDAASTEGVEFFAQASGASTSHALKPGDSVASSVGFAFVVHTDRHAELMILGVDSAGDVHWFYPAFVDAGADPRSLTVLHSLALPEAVAAEGAAAGHFELVALFSETPLRVSQVEALVADGGVAALRNSPTLAVKTLEVHRE